MDIRSLGEFNLIESIRNRFAIPNGVTGIGDDCAIIPQHDGVETLVTTDMLMEGVHFLMSDVDPFDLGWKSAAVNISDIAGMGGKPVGTFLSFSLPKSLSVDFVQRFMDGYQALSGMYSCPLLGGDTTSSLDRLCINVTVLGECCRGASRKRSDAKVGDLICVTGFLGDSGGGLQVILSGVKDRDDEQKELVRRHYLPNPRVESGLALAEVDGVHAMMDVSDGIGSDLRHILKASGVSAVVDASAIPMSGELLKVAERMGFNPLDQAVNGGEDYELLFTVAPEAEALLNVPHYVIGRIVQGEDCSISWEGEGCDFSGFKHF